MAKANKKAAPAPCLTSFHWLQPLSWQCSVCNVQKRALRLAFLCEHGAGSEERGAGSLVTEWADLTACDEQVLQSSLPHLEQREVASA